MTYLDLCAFIFKGEGYPDFDDARKIVSRRAELKTARQLSMYFGSVFFPAKSLAALAEPFRLDHATVIHAKKTVDNDMRTNGEFQKKVDRYMIELRQLRQCSEIRVAVEAAKDHEYIERLTALIDKMEIVARVYCELTGKQIV